MSESTAPDDWNSDGDELRNKENTLLFGEDPIGILVGLVKDLP